MSEFGLTATKRQEIEHWLETWHDPDNEARLRYEAAKQKWDRKLLPLQRAIERCERLTERDLQIVVY